MFPSYPPDCQNMVTLVTSVKSYTKYLDFVAALIRAIQSCPGNFLPLFPFQVANLSRKGGSSLSKDVYDMLHSMITNDLRSKIRYTGKSDKIPFANRLTANLLRGALFLSYFVYSLLTASCTH